MNAVRLSDMLGINEAGKDAFSKGLWLGILLGIGYGETKGKGVQPDNIPDWLAIDLIARAATFEERIKEAGGSLTQEDILSLALFIKRSKIGGEDIKFSME